MVRGELVLQLAHKRVLLAADVVTAPLLPIPIVQVHLTPVNLVAVVIVHTTGPMAHGAPVLLLVLNRAQLAADVVTVRLSVAATAQAHLTPVNLAAVAAVHTAGHTAHGAPALLLVHSRVRPHVAEVMAQL